MRILCFTPTYGAGPLPETLESIKSQEFSGEIVHVVSYENPYPDGDGRNVTPQYQRARRMVLDGKYDALWCVEHDMLVPPDALAKLVDTGAQVAYGVYMMRHGKPMPNIFGIRKKARGPNRIGDCLGLKPDVLAEAIAQVVVPCGGIGFGCTLMRSWVLKYVRMRPAGARQTEPPDMPFAQDCLKLSIGQVAHFGVLCGHWNGEEWLWPPGGGTETWKSLAAPTGDMETCAVVE